MRGKGYSTNIKAQMKVRNSNYRKYVAIVLQTWKNKGEFNITKTSKIIDRSKVSIAKALQQSKFYIRHPQKVKRSSNKNSFEKQMLIKNSEIRKRVAHYLKAWRKCYSIQDGAILVNIAISAFGKILMLSKMYRNQKKYDTRDLNFSLRWAKKIIGINIIGGKCLDCGENDYKILDFHHEGDKENTICRMMSGGVTWKDIETEIKKCILLCKNCHQKRHIDIERLKKLNLLIQQKIKQVKVNKGKGLRRRKGNLDWLEKTK
jgi:hypothetical protein